jgi:hypothetical protein
MLKCFSKLATHKNARNSRNFVATLVYMVGHFGLWARSLKVLKFQEILICIVIVRVRKWKKNKK